MNDHDDLKIDVSEVMRMLGSGGMIGESKEETRERVVKATQLWHDKIREAVKGSKDVYDDGDYDDDYDYNDDDYDDYYFEEAEEPEEIEAVCVNNSGLEDSFTVGVPYLMESKVSGGFVNVYNNSGCKVTCNSARFKKGK